MRLTKKIRHQIYVKALEIYHMYKDYGICHAIKASIHNDARFTDAPYLYYNMRRYPEIWMHKPANRNDSDYWWDIDEEGVQTRIAVLEDAIQLTK